MFHMFNPSRSGPRMGSWHLNPAPIPDRPKPLMAARRVHGPLRSSSGRGCRRRLPAGAQTTFLAGLPNQSGGVDRTHQPARPSRRWRRQPLRGRGGSQNVGRLHRGDVLVSNFNNSANLQGTGRTIVEISPSGRQTAFARLPELPGGTGLTTALSILPGGWVVVGNLPTNAGVLDAASKGALLVVNPFGRLRQDHHRP